VTTLKHCKFWLRMFAVATVMGAALAGCGAMRDAGTRDKVLREEMTKFTYIAPIEKVWPEAKAMFAQKGLDVTEDREEKAAGAFLFTTQWQIAKRSSSMQSGLQVRERFVVRGTKLDGGSKIEITGNIQRTHGLEGAWGNPTSHRDVHTELELVKRVEPGRAAEISAKAAAAGQKARQAE